MRLPRSFGAAVFRLQPDDEEPTSATLNRYTTKERLITELTPGERLLFTPPTNLIETTGCAAGQATEKP